MDKWITNLGNKVISTNWITKISALMRSYKELPSEHKLAYLKCFYILQQFLDFYTDNY